MSHTIIELSHVCRSFDEKSIVALDDVSLRIGKGDRVAIFGPSGSGKSTLLNILCGLDVPTSGLVRFEGAGILGRTAWARIRARNFGIVFQNFCLIPGLSAKQNVELAMLGQRKGMKARSRRAVSLLDQMGLAERMHLRPAELSGGERQRVAIARALANEPDIILADEPTGSLDQKSSRSVMGILSQLQANTGVTLVIVTHDHSIADHCDRKIEFVDGRIFSDTARRPETVGTP
jgi:ABC-type lipoprotein export system ATPase subunit